MQPCKIFYSFFSLLLLPLLLPAPPSYAATVTTGAATGATPKAVSQTAGKEHLVFYRGSEQEIEVFKIRGKEKGPTVMILGGIQGDEPGGFLSAEHYTNVSVKRGNLIIVPRANLNSVLKNHRGPHGDMNRKFPESLAAAAAKASASNQSSAQPNNQTSQAQNAASDPELKVVDVIKSLMAESDLFLNLHDGSGYYRPTWENDMANPKRYGQCIIADTTKYMHKSGKVVDLATNAQKAVAHVNRHITNPQQKFHFFNMETIQEGTKYKEQRNSATYYALTELGIPAYGIEASKQLPALGLKIYHHNLAVDSLLQTAGVELENNAINPVPAVFKYAVIIVNRSLPLAAPNGSTLLLDRGDVIEVTDVQANYTNGIFVEVSGQQCLNCQNQELTVNAPATITVLRDTKNIGKINVELKGSKSAVNTPAIWLEPNHLRLSRGSYADTPTDATVDMLPGYKKLLATRKANEQPILLADNSVKPAPAEQGNTSVRAGSAASAPTTLSNIAGNRVNTATGVDAGVSAGSPFSASSPQLAKTKFTPADIKSFMLEVDGVTSEVKKGTEFTVLKGARVKLVDINSKTPLPENIVMNLRGFLPRRNEGHNDGEDRGATANTSKDMLAEFSIDGTGDRFAINAELGKKVLAACTLRISEPKLKNITVKINGKTETLPIGGRKVLPAGSVVHLTGVELENDARLTKAQYTIGGKPLPAKLPLNFKTREIGLNLAVFNGDELAGKITFAPY